MSRGCCISPSRKAAHRTKPLPIRYCAITSSFLEPRVRHLSHPYIELTLHNVGKRPSTRTHISFEDGGVRAEILYLPRLSLLESKFMAYTQTSRPTRSYPRAATLAARLKSVQENVAPSRVSALVDGR